MSSLKSNLQFFFQALKNEKTRSKRLHSSLKIIQQGLMRKLELWISNEAGAFNLQSPRETEKLREVCLTLFFNIHI